MINTREGTSDDKLSLSVNELTTSFGFKRHLRSPKMKFDLVPVIDLIVLALLISLLFTRFLVVPGVRVDLPKTEMTIQQNAPRVAVLTIAGGNMLFFNGSVYELDFIAQAFEQYFQSNEETVSVLLVKAQASMELQEFLELCNLAQSAGFREVRVAADPVQSTQEPFIGRGN